MSSDTARVLKLIKETWPNFHITKEELTHPTCELVVRFYTNFLSDLEEKIQCLTDQYYTGMPTFNTDHLEPEDQLFIKMSSLLKSHISTPFKMSDICEPTSVRTKNFFHICCHLIVYSENIYEDVEKLTIDIIKMKDETSDLLKKHENILSEITDVTTKTAAVMDEFDNVKETLKGSQTSLEELKQVKSNKEKMRLNQKKQVDALNMFLQQEQYEINKLDNLEKELAEQVTTEEEYNHLVTTVENLESELKGLGTDDDNMDDLLLIENDEALHYQQCLKRIPNADDVSLNIVSSLLDSQKKLSDLQVVSETDSAKIGHLNLLKQQKEERLESLHRRLELFKKEEQDINSESISVQKQFKKHLSELKKHTEEQFKIQLQDKKLCLSDIAKNEEHMKKLQEGFARKYVKLSESDKEIKEHYRMVLLELNKNNN